MMVERRLVMPVLFSFVCQDNLNRLADTGMALHHSLPLIVADGGFPLTAAERHAVLIIEDVGDDRRERGGVGNLQKPE